MRTSVDMIGHKEVLMKIAEPIVLNIDKAKISKPASYYFTNISKFLSYSFFFFFFFNNNNNRF